jgi:hypothetical protein
MTPTDGAYFVGAIPSSLLAGDGAAAGFGRVGCSSARYEDRTSGPEKTEPNPIASPCSRNQRNSQTSFVDEPRRTVEEGDTLVAELMQRLANSFAEERQSLETQWDRGDDVSTEDLRVALQRYRSFFDRLLSA